MAEGKTPDVKTSNGSTMCWSLALGSRVTVWPFAEYRARRRCVLRPGKVGAVGWMYRTVGGPMARALLP